MALSARALFPFEKPSLLHFVFIYLYFFDCQLNHSSRAPAGGRSTRRGGDQDTNWGAIGKQTRFERGKPFFFFFCWTTNSNSREPHGTITEIYRKRRRTIIIGLTIQKLDSMQDATTTTIRQLWTRSRQVKTQSKLKWNRVRSRRNEFIE